MKRLADGTIAAIATPLGVGGVGVIRVSGDRALGVLSSLFSCSNGGKVVSHRMLQGWLIDPKTGLKVDRAMACYMRSPRSYTGEDVVEFYCHGGHAVMQRVLGLTLACGARLADNGEFTKRSFLNGKIDLSQAEAVLELVKARTVRGAGLAVRQLEGRLSQVIGAVRGKLIQLMAELEALIDFPDDIPQLSHKKITGRVRRLEREISRLLRSTVSARVFRVGISAVIVGKPNVGKSSLLNAILGEERAITTAIPGTTRDSIEEAVDVRGLPFRFVDTAGLGSPGDEVGILGVDRAEKELEAADFVVVVIDGSSRLCRLDKMVLEKVRSRVGVVVLNKSDLGIKVKPREIKKLAGGLRIFKVSALCGHGIEDLLNGIYEIGGGMLGSVGNEALLINERHNECLVRALEALGRAAVSCHDRVPIDFITIDLKDAVIALGEISGEAVSEEIINAIFDRFCVGK